MRRCQTEAHQHHHGSQRSPTGSREAEDKDESRLAKVKQVLAGTLLGRFNGSVQSSSGRTTTTTTTSASSRKSNACCTSSARLFGTNLELVESHLDTGVPFIVHRLCNYIETHGFQNAAVFRLSSGSPRLAERLRISFEKKGDADLEAAACPPTAASLLRQYLKELPQPVVPSAFVARLLNVHAQSYTTDHETWIKSTKEILCTLPAPHYRLLGYLVIYLGKYEAKHGRSAGICGVFAPVVLPHVPPATTLLRDILNEGMILFPDCIREDTKNTVISVDCATIRRDSRDKPQEIEGTSLPCALKPRKRKERRESCSQERKLIRSNSEERILENTKNTTDTIRRVSSQEDFHRKKDFHILSQHDQDMGHGVRCGGLPLHERTNVSPISKKPSPITSPCDVVLATERFECDAERLRSSERFSRSVTPRGRRQARRRKVHKGVDIDPASSKENEEESKRVYKASPSLTRQNGPGGGGGGGGNSDGKGQSFLEMLSSGPSRSPSPARPPTVDHEDFNNPSLTNWRYQHRDPTVPSDLSEDATDYVESISSPRNSVLIPRRFYADNVEANPRVPNPIGIGLKNLTKTINGLKKKIKKYEDEYEENFGYRPSHSDKMSNRDTKRLCTELHKLRKEYKMLKEDPMGALITNNRLNISSSSCNSNNININNNNNNNNNNSQDKARPNNIEEMVEEIQKKLREKRIKYNRPENMEELTYEQLLDEKTAVQKALLQIEETFGRPVSKDREVVRPLYDRYRSLKRQLIRASASNSIPELATILEHEAMNFTSSTLPGTSTDGERRSSEPDMSHSGILDCIEPGEQLSTDSDSQNSSSDGSRGSSEGLHALPQEELLAQQRATRQKKERLRKALKEWEAQFEARAGRRMQRRDRGPQVNIVYESYKQVKAKLKLIDALIAKNASRSI